jgi:glycosyltransferase involved in cell wall biosynthesis
MKETNENHINNNYDVTIVLITLNEIENINDSIINLQEQKAKKIIVVDAGSEDGTVDIARKLGAEVYIVGRKGLAYQRQYGVDHCDTKFIALVDADNRLDNSCISLLKEDLINSDFVGVSAQKIAYDSNSYWTRAQSWVNETEFNLPGEKMVIGTPALYYTKILKEVKYDPFCTLADDTDLCYRFSKLGYKVGAGSGICYEKMRDNWHTFSAKAIQNGVADSQFFLKHPERRFSIATHPFRNYIIKKTFRAIRKGKFQYVPYPLIYGFLRQHGFVSSIIRSFFGQSTLDQVGKT